MPLKIGEKYGHFIVLKYDGRGSNGEHRFICRCDCGNVDSFNAYTIERFPDKRCRKCVSLRPRNAAGPIIGGKYGCLTVMEETERAKDGARRFLCRCECGNVEAYSAYVITKRLNKHCHKCVPHTGGLPAPELVGKQINGWDVLEEVSREPKKTGKGLNYLFRCRCLRCGNTAVRSAGQINHKKSDRCENCPPMYNFVIHGDTAEGTLPSGVSFLIDTEDIPKVEKIFWRFNKKEGYIVTNGSFKLHRYLLDITDEKIIVDHISRDRLDNRKRNLRIVNAFQNTCNHSMLSSNRTGYIGVYFSKHSQRYEVKVGYNRKRIKLGSSKDDLIVLAQMYNVAAKYLFGDYVGELNDVPDASPEIEQAVIEKCRKYKEAPVPLKNSGAFVMEEVA